MTGLAGGPSCAHVITDDIPMSRRRRREARPQIVARRRSDGIRLILADFHPQAALYVGHTRPPPAALAAHHKCRASEKVHLLPHTRDRSQLWHLPRLVHNVNT
jgi:hypothetical protein